MPKKCGGPSCGKLVSGLQRGVEYLGDHAFCSLVCKREWLAENHIEVYTNLTERTEPKGKLRIVNGG